MSRKIFAVIKYCAVMFCDYVLKILLWKRSGWVVEQGLADIIQTLFAARCGNETVRFRKKSKKSFRKSKVAVDTKTEQ
jgi:hypothetical protein